MKPRLTACLSLLGFAILFACAKKPEPPAMAAPVLLNDALQLIVVTTPDWAATTGELRRFKRELVETAWMPVGDPVPVVVGKAGMAWGTGFDALATPVSTAGPLKQEGDNRTPAGIFTVSTAFGLAVHDSMPLVRLPYVQLKPGIECVNDTASKYYNNVVDRAAVEDAEWQSSEKLDEVPQYKLGVIVDYNPTAVKGRGSCTFLQVWTGPDGTTIGGIGLDEAALKEMVDWIQPGVHPLITQMPFEAYKLLAEPWKLPRFASK